MEGNRRHLRQKLDRSPGRGDEVTAAQLLRRRRAHRHSSASGRPALRQCSHHPRALGVQACALRVHEQYVPQPDGRGDCQAMVCGAVRVRGRGTTRRARLGHSLGRADRRGNAVSALSGLLPFSLALPGVRGCSRVSLAFCVRVHSMRSQARQHLPTASRPCSAVESIFLPIAAPCSRGDPQFTRCTLSREPIN